jgi:hypothetical protein
MGIKNPTLAHFRHFSHFRHSLIITYSHLHPFYAKQTQSQVRSNKRKLSVFKVLCKSGQLVIQTNKPKTNPIQSQLKPKQTQFKPKTNPIKANFKRYLTKMGHQGRAQLKEQALRDKIDDYEKF